MIEKENPENTKPTTEFEKALENGPDELLNVMALHYSYGVLSFMKEAEALIEINSLEEKEREKAYKLIVEKDDSNMHYKHNPSEVLEAFNKQED